MATILKDSAARVNQVRAFAFGELAVCGHGRAQEEIAAACGEQQLGSLLAAVGAAVDELTAAKAGWLAHWERAALVVATAIAARVIRREVERTPDITLALVKEALELAVGSPEVQLRMHPDDLAALGERVEELTGELTRLGDVKVVADPAIGQGGCRVDTRYGAIDQQFEAQLARIELELA
jgi:flagellar assembly protein FliH